MNALHAATSVPEEAMARVFAYLARGERRIQEARIEGWTIESLVTYRSPVYTAIPFEFLNGSELLITVAQSSQLLVDHLARARALPATGIITPGQLDAAREANRCSFAEWSVRFGRSHPRGDYRLRLDLLRSHATPGTFYASFRFSIGETARGHCIAAVPLTVGSAGNDGEVSWN